MAPATEAQIARHERLRITEIFLSLQGESRTVGWPTVFVRLTGCPLRCHYCDSEYAFTGGHWQSIDELVTRVLEYKVRHVTVTGGEPLAQKPCIKLLEKLIKHDLQVSLETSGALDIADVPQAVSIVMDIKTPGSGEVEKNRWENLAHLSAKDQIKLVLANREDYDWAKDQLDKLLATGAELLFSPVQGQLPARELADWIVDDRLPVRFQIQLHKYLWGDVPGK